MSGQFEVLSPWAEVGPISLAGISPRLADLTGKKIGLFANGKRAAAPMLAAVEQELKQRFDNLTFTRFVRTANLEVAETGDRARFEQWIRDVDAIVLAVGD
ncbi:MAG: hypothetical protein HY675_04925 [Chloroflexi bacterium]|nr:hypothetical protein [Chloroflexota bacterium]